MYTCSKCEFKKKINQKCQITNKNVKIARTDTCHPLGRSAVNVDNAESDAEPNGLRDAATASVSLATDQTDLGRQQIQEEILVQSKKMSHRLEAVEQ